MSANPKDENAAEQKKKRFSFKRKANAPKIEKIGKKQKEPKKDVRTNPTVVFTKLPNTARVVETYDVSPPHSKIIIASLPELGGGNAYYMEEEQLSESEQPFLRKLVDILSKEISPPKA